MEGGENSPSFSLKKRAFMVFEKVGTTNDLIDKIQAVKHKKYFLLLLLSHFQLLVMNLLLA